MTKLLKIFLLTGAMCLLNTGVYAQVEGKKNIFGIQIGGVVSSIEGYEAEKRTGLIGGLYWEYRIAKRFSLMSNILYSQRGEKGLEDLSDIKLDYINMPIMLKFAILPELGISTGINSDILLGTTGIGISRQDFKGSDWGIPLGISLDISKRLQLGGIINYGLMNVAKTEIPQSSQVKNHWGSFTLSYIFR